MCAISFTAVSTEKKVTTRPPGVPYPIDDTWKESVRSALTLKGWTQTELAQATGVSHAAISMLRGKATKSSRLVPKIHALFGWPPPGTAPNTSEVRQRWEDLFDRLDESTAAQLLDLGEKMVKPQ
jgi:transcriptional regulator with XRE-family HTH domain